MFPGSKPARRSNCLEILEHINENLLDAIEPKQKVIGTEDVKTLISCLEDGFDKNKMIALAVLRGCNFEGNELATRQQIDAFKAKCVELRRSTNPAHPGIACFYELLIGTRYASFPKLDSVPTKSDTVKRLMAELEEHVILAEENLGSAAENKPVYGVLLSIRTVLETFDKSSEELKLIKPLIGDFLACLIRISEIVSVILNSESPEGVTIQGQGCNPQALLLCAWRSSKEVSLLFSTLVSLCPKKRLGEDTLLTSAEVRTISDHLGESLKVLIHRGAFEQAYAGFTSVCRFLWHSEDEGLREYLDVLLRETVSAIETKELCATRRSAGVPFLIQAILAGEPKNSAGSKLDFVMMRLLELTEEKASSEVRVHACNILRSLYRTTQFGEEVGKFVEDGVKAAIRGFKSAQWAVSDRVVIC